MKIAREMGELFNKLRDETVRVSALNHPRASCTRLRIFIRMSETWTQELSSCGDGRPCGHNRRGPKVGGCCVPFHRRELGRHLTKCRLSRAYTSVPSGIRIHPAAWPE